MRKFAQIALIIIFFPLLLLSSDLRLDIDGAFFKQKDNHVRWELYYLVPDSAMKYVPVNDIFMGKLDFHVIIANNITTIEDQKFSVSRTKDSSSKFHELNLYGQKDFVIPEGQYDVKITVKDPNDTSKAIETNFKIITPDYKEKVIEISGIELAEVIAKSEPADSINIQFVRDDKLVIPNPTSQIIKQPLRLKAYTELYLPAVNDDNNNIEVSYELYDQLGRSIFKMPKLIQAKEKLIKDFVDIPVDIVATGAYQFKIKAVSARNTLDTAVSSKKVFIINMSIPPERNVRFTIDERFERSEFATMTDEDLELEFRQSKDIMTKYERENYEALSSTQAKQRYLFRYWLFRDPDTTTVINELRQDFQERVKYANTFFVVGHIPGWMTERGRVLLKYGFPERRDIYPAKDFKNPAEVWFYQKIQGGAYFYFVDAHYNNNYYLVHSNVPGEPYNINWILEYEPAIESQEVLSKFPKEYQK